MQSRPLFALLAPLAGLAACAMPPEPPPLAPGGADARCEDVTAEGLAVRQGQARNLAEEGVRHQLADARGNLLGQGLHRIRVVSKDVHCRPHTLGLGMVKCTALSRVCGR